MVNTNVDESLRNFLGEDMGYGDITTDSLVKPSVQARGRVLCKESGVVAGVEEAKILLEFLGCRVTRAVSDGTAVKPGATLLEVEGPAAGLLKVERTLLNLISHMSGVATATNELVQIARKHDRNVRVAATRKTLPGLRYFEKKAVELGGGDTHRLGLDDMVLIKDNHLAIVGSIDQAVKQARSKVSFTKKIEVEVTKPADAVKAGRAGADIILLDNMEPRNVSDAIRLLEKAGLRRKVLLEASGGIGRENIVDYARTGVDIVSVGKITNSARSIDISFELQPVRGRQKSRGN